MFAIVTIAGQQFKVTEGQAICVHRLEASEGSTLTFDQVLLVENEGNTRVGTPTVAGATVKATVLSELVKGDKVIVFKKKRRKGYRIKKGHRQQFTRIKIDAISA
jgi:large subunit ribosomal protein L21